MDSEIGSIYMTHITYDAISFTSPVDSAISSRTVTNLGASRVHSFASLLESAIRSRTASNSEASRVHSFASAVDGMIRSKTGSNLGTSRVHSFASAVDNAMRSSGGGDDLGTSRVHDFASGVDSEMRSSNGADLGTSPVHGYASAVGMRTVVARLFTLAELVAATNNFSLDNKIGVGSFGVVYRGKLVDGDEVAIKRNETSSKMKEFQEIVFGYLLTFLRRLHHKHLVGLVGFCEEKDERLLVFEYMKNGALYDHLHDKSNVDKGSSLLNSWKMRIKIALDASRGIEYLHHYAGTHIYRDIKSSNILLDATWTARLSDFGLSSLMQAVGTAGYIDPEYYGPNVLRDEYGLGVVLLELLTGKRAVFKYGEDGDTPLSVVDFAVPAILAGDLAKILDPRVGPPDVNEAEAVGLVAFTAIHCVNLEGKDRPTMADVVVNLERALAICDSGRDSISSGTVSE